MLHADIRRQTATAAARSIAAAAKTSADELLVERIALGDRLAMEALFARHRTPVIDGSFASSTTHHLPKTF